MRGLLPYSDSHLNVTRAAGGVLSSITAEPNHSSSWDTDAPHKKQAEMLRAAHRKEQQPAQWSQWLMRTIVEDFLLCQASEENSKQRKGNECVCWKWKGHPATNFRLWYTCNILTPIFITNYSFPRPAGSWQRDWKVTGWCENGTNCDLQTCHCSISTSVWRRTKQTP